MLFAEPEMQPLILAFTLIIGLVIGSFLNVAGLRLLADASVWYPPSNCPHCQAPIKPYDNIPVVSYIMLGGQCRGCKAGISIQYPLIELATGLLFVYVVWQYGLSLQSLFLLFLVANLVVIFITDLRESLIYNINSMTLIPVGLLYSALNLGNLPGGNVLDMGAFALSIPDALISAIIAVIGTFVFFEGLILLSQAAFGTEGFGHGDTFLMMGVGAFLGWPLTVMALLLGFVVQTIPAIPLLVIQWIRNKQYKTLAAGSAGVLFGLMPLVILGPPGSSHPASSNELMLCLLCLGLSLTSLVVFLKQVKQSQSFTYLPLGPALVISSLIALFWGPQILAALGY